MAKAFMPDLNAHIVDPYRRTRGGPPKPAKKCFRCGSVSSAETARCPSCGADLTGPSQVQYDRTERKKNALVILVLLAVLALFCAAAVFFLLTNPNAMPNID